MADGVGEHAPRRCGMSANAWTAGPWRCGFEPNHYAQTSAGEDDTEIACLPHMAFDAIDVFSPMRINTWEEHEANVYLISAAPDLAEAAIKALTFIETMVEEWAVGIDEAEALRAALAKARGVAA